MLIDWFTVAAQALNFLILLWLMKRFLYGPILRAIDAREQRIAAQLEDAEASKSEASRERDEFERKNEAFDRQRAELLGKATEEVAAKRQAMLDQARESADQWTARRQEALRAQADGLSRAIEDSARGEVLAIARRALQDLAGSDLESSMAEVLMQRLRALDGQAKTDFVAALGTAKTPPTVRSAFALPDGSQGAIRELLRASFSFDAPLRFEVRPDLVCGIELGANGQTVAWNVDAYLQSLRKEIGRVAGEREAQANTAPSAPLAQGEPAGNDTHAAVSSTGEDPNTGAASPGKSSLE
ncbi:MAG TPA: hypothetical protein PKC03_12355 [Dokdonella sp.]|jgi:F-type H+-transporting ATPase subunit b|nr:hypothetical protein [Dokdonella sp.]